MYAETFAVTVFVFIASFLLSGIITISYFRKHSLSVLFWASGMWLFAAAALLELLYAAGIYSEGLIDIYLFIVAFLVQLLSIGSLLLLKSGRASMAYGIFSVLSDIFLVYALVSVNVGNILLNGVVFGALPIIVIAASSVITMPAAIILVVVSIISYRKRRSWKLLSIIAGTVVVSVAGTLYIAAFPSFLYIAELAGIVLLWTGFVDFSSIFRFAGVEKHVNG